jgi:hypothetical protein
MMFSLGVLLALPLITALLVTNLALGVLSRVAPALEPVCRGLPGHHGARASSYSCSACPTSARPWSPSSIGASRLEAVVRMAAGG